VDGAVNIRLRFTDGTENIFRRIDVLEFGAHHASDDDLHLLRDTESECTEEVREAPSFAGFLYASTGLAMLLVACEQGERLDWWRSGVFNALLAGGRSSYCGAVS